MQVNKIRGQCVKYENELDAHAVPENCFVGGQQSNALALISTIMKT